MSGALPNMIILGAQKCGTTALHGYLEAHPQTSMSRPKELDFFIGERNWKHGVDWYKEHFDASADIRGESSPNYTASPHFAGVADRMASVLTDVKFIFIVRDPIERMRSQWIHNYARRNTRKAMDRAFFEDVQYLARSQYNAQMQEYLRHYPLDRFLFLEQSELLEDRDATLVKVFDFLGIDSTFTDPSFQRERRKSRKRRRLSWVQVNLPGVYNRFPARWQKKRWFLRKRPFDKPEISADLHTRVAAMIEADIAKFRELTGRDFANWSI